MVNSTPLEVELKQRNTGLIGLGGSPLGSLYSTVRLDEALSVVEMCLNSGIKIIDTAPWYQTSEIVIGKCLQKLEQYKRESFMLNTKVGRYPNTHLPPHAKHLFNDDTVIGQGYFDFSPKTVLWSVEQSLKRLGTDYIDIIQVHDVEFAKDIDQIVNETLPCLETLRKEGTIKYIGITGYSLECLKSIVEKTENRNKNDSINVKVRIDCILTYCRYGLHDQSFIQRGYKQYFEKNNIVVINASPLCMGLLTNNPTPPWHPAPKELKKVGKDAAKYCRDKNVDIAKVAIHFCLKEPSFRFTLLGIKNKQELECVLNVMNKINNTENHINKMDEISKYLLQTYFKKSVSWGSI